MIWGFREPGLQWSSVPIPCWDTQLAQTILGITALTVEMAPASTLLANRGKGDSQRPCIDGAAYNRPAFPLGQLTRPSISTSSCDGYNITAGFLEHQRSAPYDPHPQIG